ncbi:MAG: ATP-dependent 6-phosphofructokinase [Prochloraceae cyanobacterium]
MVRRRIGILTSGGDCPGLNCAIRAVVSHAELTYGWEVVGIPYATNGLLERRGVPLNLENLSVHGIDSLLSLGGTILGGINRGDPLERADEILAGYQHLGLDALIVTGGDGSLALLRQLAQIGNWKLVSIPKTIDNDVALTQRAIGFDTAVNTISEALNRLTFTAASHDRVMVVEVMGRSAGHLALHSGVAGGADIILIPEIPYSIAAICEKIRELRQARGRRFAILVVAEGVTTEEGKPSTYLDSLGQERLRGISQYIAEQIAHESNHSLETRVTILGHVQRGGLPSALDRIMAAAMGQAAVDFLAQDKYDLMVAWQNGQPGSVPLSDVLQQSPVLVNPRSYLVKTAQSLGIYVGQLGDQLMLGEEKYPQPRAKTEIV